MAQVSSKHKALSSTPSTTKIKKRIKNKRKKKQTGGRIAARTAESSV
jgi:hypothetical protein